MCAGLACLALLGVAAPAQVLTAQYDNARSGATHDTVLTPANVNANRFGKIFSLPVDGDIYAQPLYVPRVEIPGKGIHDVVYVATEHDSVYAFDAAGNPSSPLWHVSFLGSGVEPVPARDQGCAFIRPEIGITPTPVIDLPSGTIYVLARTKEGGGLLSDGRYVQKLHALAITTGAEKFGGPVEIKALVKGRGAGSSGGMLEFNPLRELPRAALLLTNGNVYLTWASSCDVGPYHGWVMAYDAHTLRQAAVWNSSPDAQESGIWQSDNGPAADDEGNIYVATGNGVFTVGSGGRDYGDSAVKLAVVNGGFEVRDYFTPFNEKEMNSEDADLGSGGPVLLPALAGARRRLLLIGGKNGVLYVLDRDGMGEYQPGNDLRAVQSFRLHGGIYSAPAYWNGHVFMLAEDNPLMDFELKNGQLTAEPVRQSARKFGNPGATPAISSNGARDGIVWIIENKGWNRPDQPAILRAFDAQDVARELYNSEQHAARDRAGMTLRFTIPTVANGRVYVEAKGKVDVYGLLP